MSTYTLQSSKKLYEIDRGKYETLLEWVGSGGGDFSQADSVDLDS